VSGKVQSGAISGDWNRDLAADLDKISKEGYDAVVSLIEDLEIDELSVQGLKEGLCAISRYGVDLGSDKRRRDSFRFYFPKIRESS
jgi:hypothetical protein